MDTDGYLFELDRVVEVTIRNSEGDVFTFTRNQIEDIYLVKNESDGD